jgi:hypothetical protein
MTLAEVDRVSLEIMGFHPGDVSMPLPVALERPGLVCQKVAAVDGVLAPTTLVLFGGQLVEIRASDASVELRLRRFAPDLPAAPTAVVASGTTAEIGLIDDQAPSQAWTLEVRSMAEAELCR